MPNDETRTGPTKRFQRRRASFELHVNRALGNLTEAMTAEQGRTRQLNEDERNKLVTPDERRDLEQALNILRRVSGRFTATETSVETTN